MLACISMPPPLVWVPPDLSISCLCPFLYRAPVAGDRATLFALSGMTCFFKFSLSALHSLDAALLLLFICWLLSPQVSAAALPYGGTFVSLNEFLLGLQAGVHIAFLLDTSQWMFILLMHVSFYPPACPSSCHTWDTLALLWFLGQSIEMQVSASWSLYSEKTDSYNNKWIYSMSGREYTVRERIDGTNNRWLKDLSKPNRW